MKTFYFYVTAFALLTLSCSQSPFKRLPASSLSIANLSQLLEALERAQDGDVITLDYKSSFDLTHEKTIEINKAITIRGYPSPFNIGQPHFFSKGRPAPMFRITSPNVVIDGLKIEGFEKDSKKDEIAELNRQGIKGVYQFPITQGIQINASNVTIKNSELMGFSHAAIIMTNAQNIIIEHNNIHHNQRSGLGYGITLSQNSKAIINNNQFDFNRHSIAGTGHSGQSYVAHHNTFGANHIDSPLDMHGGKDRKDGTQIAGRRIEIRDNVILTKDVPAFIHRGIAEEGVYIYRNVFHYFWKSDAIGYSNGITKTQLTKNKFRFYDNTFK
jgi:hypothetical protein